MPATPCRHVLTTLTAALLLAACGGGGDAGDTATSGSAATASDQGPRQRALAVATPSQAKWSPVTSLPLVASSAANLPDGRVLLWASRSKFGFGGGGMTQSAILDPVAGTVTEREVTQTGHDMFCSGTTNLPDGRLLINGGVNAPNTTLYDPATGAWTNGGAMTLPRGYNANTLLQDGSVLTLGGSWSGGSGNKHGEVWTAATGWKRLSGLPATSLVTADIGGILRADNHMALLPMGNGKVLHAGPKADMSWLDTRGSGSLTPAGRRGDDADAMGGSWVMFDAGKILKAGGSPHYQHADASTSAYVIDGTSGLEVRKVAPMAYRRTYQNAVVLPNGQVVIVGGQTWGLPFNDNYAVLVPELWDPRTETFSTMPAMAVPRVYHSVALLLPDGRVLSAGGGLCGGGCGANHPDYQVLTPPYLLKPDGTPAVRPVITQAPGAAAYGQRITVTTSGQVASFALVRLSSNTHTVNNDQRRLSLVSRPAGADRHEIDMPTNPGWALPGDWMLFAMNADGTPSMARTLRISATGAASIVPVDDASGSVGTAFALQPSISAPAGTTAAVSAANLPPGLAVNASTGRITGTPTTVGRYVVELRATVGDRTVSTLFAITIDASGTQVPGLLGEYFPNPELSGAPSRRVNEAVDANWGTGAPAAGLPADGFSSRGTGWLRPAASGSDRLQTASDDGVRVWVDGALVIDNWTVHATAVDTSVPLALTAGQRKSLRVEYFEASGSAEMRLRWSVPGTTSFAAIPAAHLRSIQVQANQPPSLFKPATQSTEAGTAVSLRITASDPDGDALRFSATGLPAGLAIDATSGLVTGRPSAAGTSNVTVTVDDGKGATASAAFTWQVFFGVPVIEPVAAPPAAAGAGIAYTARTKQDGSYQYQWDFGDGRAPTAWSTLNTISTVFAKPGVYTVTLTVRAGDGRTSVHRFLQAVEGAKGQGGSSSGPVAVETRSSGNARVWTVNPDNDSVSVFDAVTRQRLAVVAVGQQPRALAVAPDGRVWVVNKGSASVSIVRPADLKVDRTVALPRASQPHGIVVGSDGVAFVAMEATGVVARIAATGTTLGSASLGAHVRHLALSASGKQLWVSRFITPPLPGEGTAKVQTQAGGAPVGGEVVVLDAASLAVQRTVVLRHSDKEDSTVQGRGIPNYLGAPALAPDGASAWVPSKQDNILRGKRRDGLDLDFQNTVRAISSRIVTATLAEDHGARLDHDNAGLASAALHHPGGAYLFVALETSRQLAVIDAAGRRELLRVDTGRAPQGLALAADGRTLYVHNFMDRSVGAYDLRPLLDTGEARLPLSATLVAVQAQEDKLPEPVLRGKRFFYDARDVRLARDGYISCASCHSDGGHDGRVWDFTGFGEGLRNTIPLQGRAGAQGRLHWSANFDEVQDFEGQIRRHAQGTGLMTDAQFNAGTRRHPLGDRKAGVGSDPSRGIVSDLDALAAYVGSLDRFASSPWRQANGQLTAQAVRGRTVFEASCASCHGGSSFADSDKRVLHDIGTLKASSGKRLDLQPLGGVDTPTLRDAWSGAPYLHDGSAPTLEAAIQAHARITLTADQRADVAAFVRQIGGDEATAPASRSNLVVRALAELADHTGAAFEVRLDGKVVGRGQLDATGWVDLAYDTAAVAAGAAIDVVFGNDAMIGGQDRNLAVHSVTVNRNTTIASAAAGVVLDAGRGEAAFDGLDTVPASSLYGWLPWDGALRMRNGSPPPPAGQRITVRAGATPAGGIGAVMEVYHRGVRIGTVTVAGTVARDHAFTVPAVAAGDRIDVVFTNDGMVNGEDRNLLVVSVTARGQVLRPSDAGVVLDVGSGAEAFDGKDTVPAGSWGGWVPWNAAMRLVAR